MARHLKVRLPAVDLPVFQRIDQRILCKHEISKLADQGGEDAPVSFAERFLNLCLGRYPISKS